MWARNKINSVRLAVIPIIIAIGVVVYAQSRGTPSQLRVNIDATGAVVTSNAVQVAPVTSQTFANARIAVDASGNLLTTSGGTSQFIPTVIGGSGTTSTLTLQPTSGVGTTGADIIFKNGNNGATEVGRIYNNGTWSFGTPCTASGCSAVGTQGFLFTPNTANLNITEDTFNAAVPGASIIGRHARGTISSPAATASGDALVSLTGRGWETNTPGWSANNNANIVLSAAEAFTNAAQGTRITLAVTPTGSTTVGNALLIEGSGLRTALIGSAVTVANVGANSCGTTAATIAGNQTVGEVTVGATSGTQCRVAIPQATTTRFNGSCSNQTTANLCRLVAVDTTHFDLVGTFVAGDVLAYMVMSR